MNIYFHTDGQIWAKGNENIFEEYIMIEMDEDVDLWRYEIDLETNEGSIKYPTMDTEEALAQLELDTIAIDETSRLAEAAKLAEAARLAEAAKLAEATA